MSSKPSSSSQFTRPPRDPNWRPKTSSNRQNPNVLNKSQRAKLAKSVIYTQIPKILQSNSRAVEGVDSSILLKLTDIPATEKGVGYTPTIRMIEKSTFTAAKDLLNDILSTEDGKKKYEAGEYRIAVLNMCSTSQPGGGVLNGASAQEEIICCQSTLYPSLERKRNEFYPFKKTSVIYTKDILVFKDEEFDDLSNDDRFFVDVLSTAAPKRPDLKTVKKVVEGKEVEEVDYAEQGDYEQVVLTVKNLLRVCVMKGVTHVVLSALGCGAYGNPAKVVAEVFRRVVCGRRGKEEDERENWRGVEVVAFGIIGGRGKGNFGVFEEAFRDVVLRQEEEEKVRREEEVKEEEVIDEGKGKEKVVTTEEG